MTAFTRRVQWNRGAPSVGRRTTGLRAEVASSKRAPIVRLFGIVLLVAASVNWTAHPASSSPIKHSVHLSETARLDAEIGHSWAAYLMSGPRVWSTVIHPPVTPDLRTSIWKALGSTDAASNSDGGIPVVETEPRPCPIRPISPPRCAHSRSDLDGEPGKSYDRALDTAEHGHDPRHTTADADSNRPRARPLAAGLGHDRLGAVVAQAAAVSDETARRW